jgi:imidazolonepropionase-like amidohydrolase
VTFRRIALTTALFALLFKAACSDEETPAVTIIPADALVLTNGTVIDGTGADPILGGAVVIHGDRILAVGPAAGFSFSSETDTIDVGGATILPGIINAHVHETASAEARRQFLTDGVTAVCDLGTPLGDLVGFEQSQSGQGPVARGCHAGPVLTAPGGYPGAITEETVNYAVEGPEEARVAVADLWTRGVDVIKIALEPGQAPAATFPMLSERAVQAIVDEAHSHGLLVRAHAIRADMLDTALQTGVDVVEHGPFMPRSAYDASDVLQDVASLTLSEAYEDNLARLVEQGIAMVPTMDVFIGSFFDVSDPTPLESQLIELLPKIVGRFHELGGTVALGYDFGLPGIEVGMPLREMKPLLKAGLTLMEVIEAGTRNAAFVCGHGDELGTLEPGRLADVIVVDGDPLVDIETMARVVLVLKGGEIAFTSE